MVYKNKLSNSGYDAVTITFLIACKNINKTSKMCMTKLKKYLGLPLHMRDCYKIRDKCIQNLHLGRYIVGYLFYKEERAKP